MAVTQNSVIVRSFSEVWEDGLYAPASSVSVIYPGYLLYQYSGGITTGDAGTAYPTYRENADVNYPPVIVFENDLAGETIDDDIADGDYIRVKFLQVGEKYVVYGQATTAVAVGALLSPHTDGKVIANSGPAADAKTLFRAETAVAADATDTRLVVRVLRV
jgi:hypothetical protein